jgi:hypothetical protein
MKVLRGTFTGKSGQHKILLGFSKYNLSFGARKNNLQKKNTGEICINEKMPYESKQPPQFFIAFDLVCISMAVPAL